MPPTTLPPANDERDMIEKAREYGSHYIDRSKSISDSLETLLKSDNIMKKLSECYTFQRKLTEETQKLLIY